MLYNCNTQTIVYIKEQTENVILLESLNIVILVFIMIK